MAVDPSPSVLAYDLGTGGLKAAVVSAEGQILAESFRGYETLFPHASWHEQRPDDWWAALTQATADVLAERAVNPRGIRAIALSGHSLGCIPLDHEGRLLQEQVPIWSDGRATAEVEDFFREFSERDWYERTGNGFPAALYPLFKLRWLKKHRPQILAQAATLLGTKDYINYRLTGRLATDRSYASGSGFYHLKQRVYDDDILAAAGMSRALLPEIAHATDVLGALRPSIADALGLARDVQVVAGGVDNSCMALGARTFADGDLFLAMGSSSWLTLSAKAPVLDDQLRPYVFDHVVPDQYISATSIFSSGTTINWVRDSLLATTGEERFAAFDALAAASPPGARGLLMVPTLGGGTSLEGGPAVRGGFIGLDLLHGRADIARAAYEGVALGLRRALDELSRLTVLGDEITIAGGGARSALWRGILADVLGRDIVKTAVDQQAATLGAAAVALVGTGLWPDFTPLRGLHTEEARHRPSAVREPVYQAARAAYAAAAEQAARQAPLLQRLRQVSTVQPL